jgi:hypothetical protein
MTPRGLVSSLSSKAKWILGVIALITGMTTAVLIGAWPPAGVFVLLGSAALALLYIIARLRSRYDPLDPRFGSCIPPINMPGATDNTSPAGPDGDRRLKG